MKYDEIKLDMQHLPYTLSLIKYTPYGNGQQKTPETRFMIDFKRNDVLARRKAVSLAIQALRGYEEDLQAFLHGYLVTIPSHTIYGTNEPCEYLCAELAKAFPHQLVHLRQALKRVVGVQKSATAAPGERPRYEDHFHSILYNASQRLDPNTRIIIVDDIITRGETARACRDILKKATGCTDVRGLFVARTPHQ